MVRVYWNSDGFMQDHTKIRSGVWDGCPDASWTLVQLVLWLLPWGACFSAWQPSGWKVLFWYQTLAILCLSSTLFPWVLSLPPENWNLCCHHAPLVRTCRPQGNLLMPFPTRSHSSHSHSISSLLYLQSDRCLVFPSFSNRMLYNCFLIII